MSSLGIYFGPKAVDIVETKGKRFVNHLKIPLSEVLGGDLEEKVPLEVKIVALFSEALRKSKIESKEAVLSLSARDLIIRTFEMPNLPKEEMVSAINFEVKKYIPFKVEDLISDYQIEPDRQSHINTVLFVGIKKETFDKYFSIFNQLNIKVNQIEYCGFSIMRALKLAGVKSRGVIGVLCVDFQQDDEVNFIVLEDGVPLFSRDINLSLATEGFEGSQASGQSALEKLKIELRVSLDYYHRKFPEKTMQKIVVIANQEQAKELDVFMNELDLSGKFIDLIKLTGKVEPYSSSFIKSYSASLDKAIPIQIKINLMEAKLKLSRAGILAFQMDAGSLFKGIKIDYRAVLGGVLICLAALGLGFYQAKPLNQELEDIVAKRINVGKINPNASYDELSIISSEYKKKLNNLDNLIRKQLYLTETLDAIPRSIPEGVWLVKFSLNKKEVDKAELILEGMSYLKDSGKEFEAVNKFLDNLKQNNIFAKYFQDISINFIDQKQMDKVTATSFLISCKNYKEGR
ncbi:MAG: hypothetical protein COT38_01110 [Candidatus Omnitrophica bacterium CG08_land_8_20_14_0_20_41_16]|uniref:SHS2 domain-containing protein n=1 Tax=Candidatus Sherwoodlollariibacterium unditelluris TaxID=1974757 RepID=A0A2G9YHR5_9BACT|nr:MAG: hypothetical protein COX41_06605 [Candidatus Omnitrophica bacterium CG23_combo_of_CG06-09_8_20_14_all_41_10]PIS34239.1 MAG: hypothetical protein COT38_01110 [Candidatus Omnitrophica bacterium CG08_land_8_20_14_0_20_41_16]